MGEATNKGAATTTTANTVSSQEIRTLLAREIEAHGVAPIARLLGVDRSSLTNYVAGRARAGNVLMIELQASAVYGTDDGDEGGR